jgi:hypothetical protein
LIGKEWGEFEEDVSNFMQGWRDFRKMGLHYTARAHPLRCPAAIRIGVPFSLAGEIRAGKGSASIFQTASKNLR